MMSWPIAGLPPSLPYNTNDGTYWELIAVSATGDPTGEYYRYAFDFPVFNDYPKLGVWPDAYYCSFNMFGDYRRVAAAAYEREALLAGDPDARQVVFDLPDGSNPWSMLPADFDGPAPPDGAPNYWLYATDDVNNVGDYLRLWEFKVDWDSPLFSTFQEVQILEPEPFDHEICDAYRNRCIPQPDDAPWLETLSDRLMYRLQYRNFGTYEVMVTNHTVDVDGFGHAGIRWYELRKENDVDGWYIYQQGTYAPDDDHRWMGSIAMDGKGNIALGYSVSSTITYPAIRYTGRPPGAPLGEMTFYEEEIMEGGGAQFGDAARWGDYSMMSVDPSNDTTFWFTTEYYASSGGVSWQTRIAAFNLVEDLIPPSAVTDLQASMTTTNAVKLDWTATGNDGMEGTAFLYDIRYNTEAISETNWDESMKAENEMIPSAPGTAETFTVAGLDYDTDYYFGLKVRDKQFNFSGLSNPVASETSGPPAVELYEPDIVQKLFGKSIATRPWVIGNTGETDFNYQIIKIPDTTGQNPGALLGEYLNGSMLNMGLAWVDGYLYMLDIFGDALHKYDTATQQKVDTYEIHNDPYGIAWDGNYFWIGNSFGEVQAYNPDGTLAGMQFNCPFQENPALAWTGENFIANRISQSNPKLYEINPNGKIINIYLTDIDDETIFQSCWVPQHFMGQYWFTNNSGSIGQLKLEGESAVLISKFDAPAASSSAITHDQSNLWQGATGGKLFYVEDGIDEVNWLIAEPSQGTISSESTQDINLTINTLDLPDGDQEATMVLLTNQPDKPEIPVPLDIVYTNIDLGPDSAFCGHLNITLDAGSGYAGYLWSDDSDEQTLVVDSSYYGLGTATVWVEVTDDGGLTDSDTVLITFQDCAGILEFRNDLQVKVYPNPTNGMVQIELSGLKDAIQIQLIDLNGQDH